MSDRDHALAPALPAATGSKARIMAGALDPYDAPDTEIETARYSVIVVVQA